jgi:hypothetical protein
MDETRYRLNRLRDEMDYYLVTTPSDDVESGQLDLYFREQQAIWHDVSQRWVTVRKLGAAENAAPSGQGINVGQQI